MYIFFIFFYYSAMQLCALIFFIHFSVIVNNIFAHTVNNVRSAPSLKINCHFQNIRNTQQALVTEWYAMFTYEKQKNNTSKINSIYIFLREKERMRTCNIRFVYQFVPGYFVKKRARKIRNKEDSMLCLHLAITSSHSAIQKKKV